MKDFSQTCEDTSRLRCLRREEVSTGSGSDRVLDRSEGRVWQEDYPVATAPGTDLLAYQAATANVFSKLRAPAGGN
ncbi:MAG: hypothetical protein QOH71_3712 [Blastocatellia bacterium]|jgi:hypothetical protein|nr:hypothetical protein [Blastocatellia bacterium]